VPFAVENRMTSEFTAEKLRGHHCFARVRAEFVKIALKTSY
jgi:hypothetical protein